MKISYLNILLSCFFAGNLVAQTPVTVDIKQFYAPAKGNYIEVYTSFDPAFFELKQARDSGLYCQVQELVLIKAGERIVDYRKKNIKSPYFSDSLIEPFTQVERFTIPAGNYVLEYELNDLLKKDGKPLSAKFTLDITNRDDKTILSQVELVEKISSTITSKDFSKSGYEIWPYVSNFYPDYIEKLAWYTEVYFSKADIASQEKYVMMQYISSFETNEKLDKYAKLSKITAQEVFPILNSFDIKQLPSGNYNLVMELRNRENKIVSSEIVFFQRLNQTQALSDESINATSIEGTFVENITNLDSLDDYIGSIRPIASNSESDMAALQLRNGNPLSKKQFLYLFWKAREPLTPEQAWRAYKSDVRKVNKLFGTRIKRGYETDRGRIYLKYGAPNQVTDRANEPSAYPYQIWQYYKVGKFNNKFFMFYMPDLVSNDYEVLNSDVPGEYRNPRWQAILYSRNSTNPNVDFPNQGNSNHYGGNANELLKNPR